MAEPVSETVELELAIGQLEPDARRALLWIARRLLVGQKEYGALDLAKDPRDWRKERGEEIQDLLVYSAFAELKAMAAKS